RQTRSQRQRISRQRSGLINRAERRKFVHNFGAPPKRANRQAAANHLPQRGEVRFHPIDFLRATASQAETGDHFIEDQKRVVGGAFLAQNGKKITGGKIESRIGRDRFHDDCRNLPSVFSKRFAQQGGVVKRQ